MRKKTGTILLFAIVALFSACSVGRKTIYFNDLPEDERVLRTSAPFQEPKIKPDDILNIDIQTVDPGSTSALTQGSSMQLIGASSAHSISNQQTTGFLVDKMGF